METQWVIRRQSGNKQRKTKALNIERDNERMRHKRRAQLEEITHTRPGGSKTENTNIGTVLCAISCFLLYFDKDTHLILKQGEIRNLANFPFKVISFRGPLYCFWEVDHRKSSLACRSGGYCLPPLAPNQPWQMTVPP